MLYIAIKAHAGLWIKKPILVPVKKRELPAKPLLLGRRCSDANGLVDWHTAENWAKAVCTKEQAKIIFEHLPWANDADFEAVWGAYIKRYRKA